MASITAGTALALASTAITTGVAAMGAQAQAANRKAAANYQAAVAEQNQRLAQDAAKEERRAGYEAMLKERQKTALAIGRQRAAQGASGTAVDFGSNLEANAALAEQGEADALAQYQKGLDAAWNHEIQAWNQGRNAEAKRAAASAYSGAAGRTLVGGLTRIGTQFGLAGLKDPSGRNGYPTISL